jgi:hypothetical protein
MGAGVSTTFSQLEWPALMRMLDHIDPSFRQ